MPISHRHKVFNPRTGRWVKKTGKIGKQIIALQKDLEKNHIPLAARVHPVLW